MGTQMPLQNTELVRNIVQVAGAFTKKRSPAGTKATCGGLYMTMAL